jgi:hypothetical protein
LVVMGSPLFLSYLLTVWVWRVRSTPSRVSLR